MFAKEEREETRCKRPFTCSTEGWEALISNKCFLFFPPPLLPPFSPPPPLCAPSLPPFLAALLDGSAIKAKCFFHVLPITTLLESEAGSTV